MSKGSDGPLEDVDGPLEDVCPAEEEWGCVEVDEVPALEDDAGRWLELRGRMDVLELRRELDEETTWPLEEEATA